MHHYILTYNLLPIDYMLRVLCLRIYFLKIMTVLIEMWKISFMCFCFEIAPNTHTTVHCEPDQIFIIAYCHLHLFQFVLYIISPIILTFLSKRRRRSSFLKKNLTAFSGFRVKEKPLIFTPPGGESDTYDGCVETQRRRESLPFVRKQIDALSPATAQSCYYMRVNVTHW